MSEGTISIGQPSPRAFLSTIPAGEREERLALAVVIVSALCFVIAAPFAQVRLTPVPAFIPIYESALVINDLITALLLFGQFAQLRSTRLLMLGCGYLFNVLLIVPHALTFPGVFSATGWLGAGPQTTAWIYMFWHGGFPVFAILYVASGRGSARESIAGKPRASREWAALRVIAAMIGAAILLTLLATAGQRALPSIMEENAYTPAMHFVITSVWGSSLLGLFVLWRKRPRSVLDIWLMVVLFVSVCDVGLSAVLNAGRFDLGFYAGRIYGWLASGFVLAVLLLETSGLYSRLAKAKAQLEDRTRELEGDIRHRIAEQEQTEAQLRHAQRMEAIGALTGGLAHDFNNLLGVIIGNLDLARPRLGPDSEVREMVGDALDAATRGAELTQRLLAFARRQPLRPALLQINERVRDVTRLLQRTLGENVVVRLDLSDGLWPVMADPTQLEASITNIATNARDAMPNGGQLRIKTANMHLDEHYAASHGEVAVGDYAMIEISDTGTGMPPDVASRVFEPFFTTKEKGKGSGLGLSMVFGFIKQSRGHVSVYSEPARGTTFRLFLPRSEASRAEERAAAAETPLKTGSERILVVEDNDRMRRIAARQLSELGYDVIEAGTAAAALDTLASGKSIRLLFTDVVMPGAMDGIALAREAHARQPDLKVLLTSGFPEGRFDEVGALPPGVRLLSKPYRNSDLARIVREVLDSESRPGDGTAMFRG